MNYCNKEIDAKIDAQSAMADQVARKALVQEIDRALQKDAARPVIFHTRANTCRYPYVKGLTIAENSQYNHWRMEDVWLDK